MKSIIVYYLKSWNIDVFGIQPYTTNLFRTEIYNSQTYFIKSGMFKQ